MTLYFTSFGVECSSWALNTTRRKVQKEKKKQRQRITILIQEINVYIYHGEYFVFAILCILKLNVHKILHFRISLLHCRNV